MQGLLDQAIIFWSKQGLELGYKYWLGGSGLAVTGCPSNSRLGGWWILCLESGSELFCLCYLLLLRFYWFVRVQGK